MKNKNKKGIFRNEQGFTLLELLVVIAIVGIMTSVGLVSLISSKRQIALKTAQDEVAATIKLAQSYALQGKNAGLGVCGFGFKFTNNIANSPYEIFSYTTDGADCTGNKNENTVESQNLKNGVLLSSPALVDDTKIYFSIPSATLYNSAGAIWPGGTFSFTLGETRTITISSSGLVTEN